MYAYGLTHVHINGKLQNFQPYGVLAIWIFARRNRVEISLIFSMLFRQFFGGEFFFVFHFDAENAYLSIGEVFRAIPALIPSVFEPFQLTIPCSEERELPL